MRAALIAVAAAEVLAVAGGVEGEGILSALARVEYGGARRGPGGGIRRFCRAAWNPLRVKGRDALVLQRNDRYSLNYLINGPIDFAISEYYNFLRKVTLLYLKLINQKDRWIQMKKVDLLYEGKAKKVYTTEDPDVLIVDYKDDATAFNGSKKGTIVGKGAINNRMTNHIFKLLEAEGVPTHYIEELSDRETAVKKVEIVPLEVIIRNFSAGSFAKKMGMEEGVKFKCPTLEFSYKNDDLGDPFINKYYALSLELATEEEIDAITKYAFKVNEVMQKYFDSLGIELIDFKIEFGRYHGQVILADEVSPDTCRLWDKETHEKLDKDRFRRDLGNVEDAYNEVFRRLGIADR